MIRALFWKEWQELRGFVLGVLVLSALVSLITFRQVGIGGMIWNSAIIFLILMPLGMSAHTFCSEKDEGTRDFLSKMPLSPTRLFLIRYFFVAGVCYLLLLILLCFTVILSAGKMELAAILQHEFEEFALVLPFAICTVVSAAALCAAFADTVIATAVLALPLALGALLYQAWIFHYLRLAPWLSETASLIMSFTALFLFSLLFLLAAFFAQVTRRKLKKVAAAFFCLLIAFLIPLLCFYASFLLFMAPLGKYELFWFHPNHEQISLTVDLEAHEPGKRWRLDDLSRRALVLHVPSGKTHWLTNWRMSRVAAGLRSGNGWSPDGKRLLFYRAAEVQLPLLRRDIPSYIGDIDFSGTEHVELCVYESATQKVLTVPDLELSKQGVGWYWFNDRMVYKYDFNSASVLFVDWRTGKKYLCKSPGKAARTWKDAVAKLPGKKLKAFSAAIDSYVAAVYETAEGKALLRMYKPELETATEIELDFPVNLDWEHVSFSSDSRRLLFSQPRKEIQPAPAILYTIPDERYEVIPPFPENLGLKATPEVDRRFLTLLNDGRVLARIAEPPLLAIYNSQSPDADWKFLPLSAAAEDMNRINYLAVSPNERFAAARLFRRRTVKTEIIVTDLLTGRNWCISRRKSADEPFLGGYSWQNNNRIIVSRSDGLWLLSKDGSESRKLLSLH